MPISRKDSNDIVVDYMTDYAKYVATSRAIPALMDGFKPVQRRIMASSRDLGIWSHKPTLKSAKVAGEVLGNYHPHGDAYGPLVGMTQPFKIRYPLFEGQGNWGSADIPGSVAAPRYTEVRLTPFAEKMYLDDADYGDYGDNYDGRLKELTLMYPVLPGCMWTGASGIAVGLSTNVPTHRIPDVGNSFLRYLEDPTSKTYLDDIMPETVEKSVIVTPKSDIRKMYETGAGSIRYKAKTHYEVIDGKPALVIDAFPPGFSKRTLQTPSVMAHVESGDLTVLNESKVDVRYVFIAKTKDILQEIEDRLYKSVGYRFFIDHRGVIKQYPLADIYETFAKERSDFIVRKYNDLLGKSQVERDYLDVLVKLKQDKAYIKDMFDKDYDVVIKEIVARYSTTEDIAKRVVATSIRSLLKDNEADLLSKLQKRQDEITLYTSFVNDPLSKVKKDVEDLLSDYSADERRAVHELDDSRTFTVDFNGQELEMTESDEFFIATATNEIRLAVGAELLSNTGIKDLVAIVPADKTYYVAYDEKGLVGMERDVLASSGSKFKSEKLLGLLALDDLSTVELTLGNGKVQRLADWILRKRASYITLSDDGQPDIKLEVK